jgi:hypothetical protein
MSEFQHGYKRISSVLQRSKGVLDRHYHTQANTVSLLNFFNVSLNGARDRLETFVELVGLASLLMFLYFKLLEC